jgi:hypothetical protein
VSLVIGLAGLILVYGVVIIVLFRMCDKIKLALRKVKALGACDSSLGVKGRG